MGKIKDFVRVARLNSHTRLNFILKSNGFRSQQAFKAHFDYANKTKWNSPNSEKKRIQRWMQHNYPEFYRYATKDLKRTIFTKQLHPKRYRGTHSSNTKTITVYGAGQHSSNLGTYAHELHHSAKLRAAGSEAEFDRRYRWDLPWKERPHEKGAMRFKKQVEDLHYKQVHPYQWNEKMIKMMRKNRR